MERVETRIISGAMYELANTIQSDDGVANAACREAAMRLDEQTVEIGLLKKKLKTVKKIYGDLASSQIGMPPEFAEMVDANFWDLI